MTKKEEFISDYAKAIETGYHYLIVAVKDLLTEDTEIITNYYATVPNKMKYYFDYYNDDLQLIRSTDIRIYKWMFA